MPHLQTIKTALTISTLLTPLPSPSHLLSPLSQTNCLLNCPHPLLPSENIYPLSPITPKPLYHDDLTLVMKWWPVIFALQYQQVTASTAGPPLMLQSTIPLSLKAFHQSLQTIHILLCEGL